jgi:hypothetical protein
MNHLNQRGNLYLAEGDIVYLAGILYFKTRSALCVVAAHDCVLGGFR